MELSFIDHCLIQAMNDSTCDGVADQTRLANWADGKYAKAKALQDVRERMTAKAAEEKQKHVNADLEHRSAIS